MSGGLLFSGCRCMLSVICVSHYLVNNSLFCHKLLRRFFFIWIFYVCLLKSFKISNSMVWLFLYVTSNSWIKELKKQNTQPYETWMPLSKDTDIINIWLKWYEDPLQFRIRLTITFWRLRFIPHSFKNERQR